MSDIAIKVKHISKIYKLYDKPIDRMKESLSIFKTNKYGREHYALNDISFDINRGETVGIVGTNGSGKSTLLKIITGVLSQSYGNIEVNGKISALLELGAGFNQEYTGIENIYLNGMMSGLDKSYIDTKIDEIIKFADIGEFINQKVKTYSSGMFVRLAFAVAINIKPDILIVDEALAVGDPKFQAKCYKKIEEFKKQGNTILMVSHDTDSIKRFSDRAMWIDKGTLKMIGKTDEIVSKYNSFLYNDNLEEDFDYENIKNCNDSFAKIEKESFENAISRWGIKSNIIKNVLFNKRNDKFGISIKYNEKINIDVLFYLDEELSSEENIYASISIKNKKGQDIIFMTTKDNNFKGKKCGLYKVSFNMENILSNSQYYIVVCIEKRNDFDISTPIYYDYIDGAVFFDVEASERKKYSMVDIDYDCNISIY